MVGIGNDDFSCKRAVREVKISLRASRSSEYLKYHMILWNNMFLHQGKSLKY